MTRDDIAAGESCNNAICGWKPNIHTNRESCVTDMTTAQSSGKWIVPERIQVESVYGCNASCTMCPVNNPGRRKKGVMPFETFKYVMDELSPYNDRIRMVDLFGLGEPLLDHGLHRKISYAKKMGFRSVAISTNADLLSAAKAREVFEAGLDTAIISIDGVHKATHEAIRVNTDFDRVWTNAERAVRIRNENAYGTRFVFRFLRQPSNHREWEAFRKAWGGVISMEKGDKIIGYDIHNWGGSVDLEINGKARFAADKPCHHVFDRLIVLADGTIPLCCVDLHEGRHGFGNLSEGSPMEIFNNKAARKMRELHSQGHRLRMKICAECTILESESAQFIEQSPKT